MNLWLVSDVECTWQILIDWSVNQLKGRSLKFTICKLAWWATVYHLWQQRNANIHSKNVRNEEQIIKDIKKDVKGIIESKRGLGDSVLKKESMLQMGHEPVCTVNTAQFFCHYSLGFMLFLNLF